MFHSVLLGLMVIQALFLIVALFYIATSLHFEDRIVGTNLVGTIVINFITMLAAFMNEGYGMDIALVYAFLSFLAVVVLCRLLGVQNVERQLERIEKARAKQEKAAEKAKADRDAEQRELARRLREEESERLRSQLEAVQGDHTEGGEGK
jgi:multicomponent Na+:H+ antiporter subunit F